MSARSCRESRSSFGSTGGLMVGEGSSPATESFPPSVAGGMTSSVARKCATFQASIGAGSSFMSRRLSWRLSRRDPPDEQRQVVAGANRRRQRRAIEGIVVMAWRGDAVREPEDRHPIARAQVIVIDKVAASHYDADGPRFRVGQKKVVSLLDQRAYIMGGHRTTGPDVGFRCTF